MENDESTIPLDSRNLVPKLKERERARERENCNGEENLSECVCIVMRKT